MAPSPSKNTVQNSAASSNSTATLTSSQSPVLASSSCTVSGKKEIYSVVDIIDSVNDISTLQNKDTSSIIDIPNLIYNGISTNQSVTLPLNTIGNNNQENSISFNSINCNNFNINNSFNSGVNSQSSNFLKQNYPHSSSTFSLNKNEEFHFIKPSECPVFKPNEEEFKNPLAYIGKIRPFAEKFGIAKIQPPKSWTPPFTVDVDKLKFTPRVQRLNELEAKTRVKLNFLDQIAKFWELQGSSLKIPMVERKALDLYSLHRIVQEEGGIEQTTKERRWSRVANRMGYPSGKSIGAILKSHYERILHPFDIFTSGKTVDIKLEAEIDDQDYKPHGIVSRQQIKPPNETTARRSKRFANASQATCGLGLKVTNIYSSSSVGNSSVSADNAIKEEVKDEYNSIGYGEYKRMHSYGFGGKMATGGCGRNRKTINSSVSVISMKKGQKKNDPLAKYICHFCNRGDAEENMLLCDGCDDSYHTFCLMPPLNDIPKGDWRCPKCVVEEVSKPQEAFGFEQAQREYSLQQFGEMADQFKADYFNMAVHLVPTDLVEREFWRIVSSIDEDVTVEYGADLHTMDHGSGFPTKSSLNLLPGDQEYADSSWNLNNLPILEESILGHINADISGMKVPWMYVGMCFATFCWHNEDHWSYSINYLHWGEPKTWYGVPGSKAEAFEETMKSAAPELFHSQPDLLHQLVTIMNPNILMKNNVPVYRTDQHAGEFVITFPRAYHAGFNQGYNFAEAVNFAPADWMKMGRECINHYSILRRFCVFSHDELVCKMALNPDKLNLGIATACYLDMAEMVDGEKKLRKSLLEWGVTKAEREAFELIPDDERQCHSCKTTCFLSAVTCTCTKLIVCLRHYSELCSCSSDKHTLQYRYTLDELPLMLKKLKVKAETFETWLSRVRDVLDPNTPTTITLEELQSLAQEAEEKKFPSSVILERLNSAVLEAEKCVTVIQQLDINKMRTRTRNSAESAKYKLTMDELNLFVQEINNLCCIIQEGQSVRDLQLLGKDFIESSKHVLSKKLNKNNEVEIEQLIEEGSFLCIDLPEMERLKNRYEQLKWYKKVREYRDSNEKISFTDIHNFLREVLNIVPDVFIEKELVHLQKIVLAIEYWEEVAKKCFESGTQHELPEIEVLLEKAHDIEGELPSEPALRDAVRKAKEWLQNVEEIQTNENYPYFHTLENVVNRGKSIPFHLEELKRMEEHLQLAKNWKDKTAKTFLKKQTQFHLMDVLSPRTSAVMIGSRFKKKLPEDEFSENMTPQQMVNQFKNAEEKEMVDMRNLRKLNMEKNPQEDKYCICKRKFTNNMLNCQLCKDWFHEQCVPLPKNTIRTKLQYSSPQNNCNFANSKQKNSRDRNFEFKYLCPSCMRSRRPRLETILQLLVSLQRLPLRLPEGEALQCLTERAMNWQDRARQAFLTENVSIALSAVSLMPSKFDESCKTKKILNENVNGKYRRKKLCQSKCQKINAKKTLEDTNINKRKYVKMMINKNTISEDDDIYETTSEEELGQIKIGHNLASAVTTEIENEVSPNNLESMNISENFSGVASNFDEPLINLDEETRQKVEDLMMEGDLLEVSLDETTHLWKILKATNPCVFSNSSHINYKYVMKLSGDALIKKNAVNRKRQSEENTSYLQIKKIKNQNNSFLTELQQTALQSEQRETKLKRGRKIKNALFNKMCIVYDESNFTDIHSSTLNNSCEANIINSNTEDLSQLKTIKTTQSDTNVLSLGSLDQSVNSPLSFTNKKRKRTTTGSVTTKKAAAAAAAAAAQAELEQIAAVATAATSTSDDDEECSAPNCARPSGREVDWVQCDGGCNKWFHMFCVGLDKNEIKPDDDYICKRCTKANQKILIISSIETSSETINHSINKSSIDVTQVTTTKSVLNRLEKLNVNKFNDLIRIKNSKNELSVNDNKIIFSSDVANNIHYCDENSSSDSDQDSIKMQNKEKTIKDENISNESIMKFIENEKDTLIANGNNKKVSNNESKVNNIDNININHDISDQNLYYSESDKKKERNILLHSNNGSIIQILTESDSKNIRKVHKSAATN